MAEPLREDLHLLTAITLAHIAMIAIKRKVENLDQPVLEKERETQDLPVPSLRAPTVNTVNTVPTQDLQEERSTSHLHLA